MGGELGSVVAADELGRTATVDDRHLEGGHGVVGSTVPTSLIFEQQTWSLIGRQNRHGRVRVIVLLAYSTRFLDLFRLIVTLVSLRACGQISLRPHPRRVWPARCLAVLPSVHWQDSRHSELSFAAERGDVILTTTVGTPLIAAHAMPCDVYGIAPLDGAIAGAADTWQEAMSTG